MLIIPKLELNDLSLFIHNDFISTFLDQTIIEFEGLNRKEIKN